MLASFVKNMNLDKTVESYLETRDFGKDYLYSKLFPLKRCGTLDYTSIIGSRGSAVAAAVVAYDSPAPLGRRKTISVLRGKIPSVRIKRKMSENDLLDLMQLKSNPQTMPEDLLDLLAGDIDFRYDSNVSFCGVFYDIFQLFLC